VIDNSKRQDKKMRKVLIVTLGLVSLGLSVQLASAAKGKDCIAEHKACKAGQTQTSVLVACQHEFAQCVNDNKNAGLNPYGNPARASAAGGPGNLKDIPGATSGSTTPSTDTHAGVNFNASKNPNPDAPAAGSATSTGVIAGGTTAGTVAASTQSKPATGGGAPAPAPHSGSGRSNLRAQ
jgi:hypothetical protein